MGFLLLMLIGISTLWCLAMLVSRSAPNVRVKKRIAFILMIVTFAFFIAFILYAHQHHIPLPQMYGGVTGD